MTNVSLQIPKRIVPQGMPVHMLLEVGDDDANNMPSVRVSSVDPESGLEIPNSTPLESFDSWVKGLSSTAIRLDTQAMSPGEYLVAVESENNGVEGEESFWVLDPRSYELLLDDIEGEGFEPQLRIDRSDLRVLLRRKLIERGDVLPAVHSSVPVPENRIRTRTVTSCEFMKGGNLPLAKINYGFDCLVDDFMYLGVFSGVLPGSKSITLKVDESGNINLDAAARLIVPLASGVDDYFIFHSSITRASRKWPDFFQAQFGLEDNHFRLSLYISQLFRGKSKPDELAPPLVNEPQVKVEDEHAVEVATDAEEALEREPVPAGSI